MGLFNKPKYTISEEVFEELKADIAKLQAENKRLQERSNFGHLESKIDSLEKELASTKLALSESQQINANLNNTLERERASTSLILKTLKESQQLNERLYGKLSCYETIELRKIDFYV